MRYGSVCSGIEAASVAWEPLGWKPVFFSEIEPFPSSVLAHHWPKVPNLGDMTKFQEWGYGTGSIDLLVGGTPCQSFSIAGLRGGLDDPRGNLALVFARMVEHLRPRWVVWENVPGVLSSNGGRDFASILGAFHELGYGWAYRVLDAQHFGVPQRRRRVFLVASAGDWRGPAAVLFERESLRGHTEARRKASKAAPMGARDGADESGITDPVGTLCSDTHPGAYSGQDAYTGRLVPDVGGGGGLPRLSRCLNAGGMGRQDWETETLIPTGGFFDGPKAVDLYNQTLTGDVHVPLRTAQGHGAPAVLTDVPFSFAENSRGEVRLENGDGQRTGTISHGGGKPGQGYPAIASTIGVRRLTPTECERLQGFPDGHTLVKHRGKMAADGPRYKAIGNSMAVPVMNWIGQRIQKVDSILLS